MKLRIVMSKSNNLIIVITTTDQKQIADKITQELLQQKLAACIQIEQVISHYIWQNKKEETLEYRLQIKSLSTKYKDIEAYIRRYHNYDLPEIIAYEVTHCREEYAQYIAENIKA